MPEPPKMNLDLPELPVVKAGSLITLNLSNVVRNPKLDIRAERDPEISEQYASVFRLLPKMKVFRVTERNAYYLVDGWYTFDAALKNNIHKLEFEYTGRGTLAQAFAIAVKSNRVHGVRLTRPDWVKIAHETQRMYSEKDANWSMRQTATVLNIPYTTVQKWFRFPDGMSEPPVDHGLGRSWNGNGKRKPHDVNDFRVMKAVGWIQSAVKQLEKIHVDELTPAQKARFIKPMQGLQKYWEKINR